MTTEPLRLKATLTLKHEMCAWQCEKCDMDFVVLNVIRCTTEDYNEPFDQIHEWGNPERPPHCPHCGSADEVRR